MKNTLAASLIFLLAAGILHSQDSKVLKSFKADTIANSDVDVVDTQWKIVRGKIDKHVAFDLIKRPPAGNQHAAYVIYTARASNWDDANKSCKGVAPKGEWKLTSYFEYLVAANLVSGAWPKETDKKHPLYIEFDFNGNTIRPFWARSRWAKDESAEFKGTAYAIYSSEEIESKVFDLNKVKQFIKKYLVQLLGAPQKNSEKIKNLKTLSTELNKGLPVYCIHGSMK